MEIENKVKETLTKLLAVKPEELKPDVKLSDSIGVDSTEMVEVNIALEKAFGVKISSQDVTKFSTLNDIVNTIKTKIGA